MSPSDTAARSVAIIATTLEGHRSIVDLFGRLGAPLNRCDGHHWERKRERFAEIKAAAPADRAAVQAHHDAEDDAGLAALCGPGFVAKLRAEYPRPAARAQRQDGGIAA